MGRAGKKLKHTYPFVLLKSILGIYFILTLPKKKKKYISKLLISHMHIMFKYYAINVSHCAYQQKCEEKHVQKYYFFYTIFVHTPFRFSDICNVQLYICTYNYYYRYRTNTSHTYIGISCTYFVLFRLSNRYTIYKFLPSQFKMKLLFQ